MLPPFTEDEEKAILSQIVYPHSPAKSLRLGRLKPFNFALQIMIVWCLKNNIEKPAYTLIQPAEFDKIHKLIFYNPFIEADHRKSIDGKTLAWINKWDKKEGKIGIRSLENLVSRLRKSAVKKTRGVS